MRARNRSVAVVVLSVLWGVPAVAQQQNLGALITEAGRDWMIGKWQAADDIRGPVELDYAWTLDKCAVLAEVRFGRFKYHGMILYVPSRRQVVQTGGDNMGGFWTGMWSENNEGAAVYRMEYLASDGTASKTEQVYVKVDNDTFKVRQYAVDAGGNRASEPREVLTFTRRKDAAPPK